MKRGATDMTTPVTRGELREELAQLEVRLEQKSDERLDLIEQKLDARIDRLEQKLDHNLELWRGILLARLAEFEQRLLTELGRQLDAAQEALTKQISAIGEKYVDPPARVHRLEARVLARRRR